MRDQLVGGAKNVTALRANILSAVADIRAYTSEVRNNAAATQSTSTQTMAVALQQASQASRVTTAGFMHDYYDRRIFNPYLRFASTDDEEEYRRREDERRRAIEKALAEHTPEGNLQANHLAIEQLKDAGAHGADRSPEYKPAMKSLTDTGDALAGQIATAKGQHQSSDVAAGPADKAKPASPVPDDVIARLRAAQASSADDLVKGHGLATDKSPSSGLSI